MQISHVAQEPDRSHNLLLFVRQRGDGGGQHPRLRVEQPHLVALHRVLLDGAQQQGAEFVVERKLFGGAACGDCAVNAEEAGEGGVSELHSPLVIDDDDGVAHLLKDGGVVAAFALRGCHRVCQ